MFGRDFTLLGRLVTIASFLVCLPLLYALTLRLWRSRTAAALAMFWFSAARGLVFLAIGSIVADFVLTACVLLYFILLLDALREDKPAPWIRLGAAHGLAFLAKAIAMPWLSIASAIAMPWLSIASAIALLLRNGLSPRRLAASFLLAFLFPAIVWVSWGAALRTKYGVFTTGYQLRANLMTNWRRQQSHHRIGDSLAFSDTSSLYDHYMVGESWPSVQAFSLRNAGLFNMILATEARTVPQAVKETLILLTPAGALAIPFMLALLVRNRGQYQPEAAFAGIALLSALSLIVAYCMLVFDGRYLIPIVPVLIAICCPLLLPSDLASAAPHVSPRLKRAGLGLLAASIFFFAVYWASPFRTVDRDFQASCYQAAAVLRNAGPAGTLVSIGDGPYPEHGVGFEAGPYLAYLAGWRLVGGNSELPQASDADALASKALAAKANAVVVWGSPADPAYVQIAEKVKFAEGSLSDTPLTDPYKGEVGTAVLFRGPIEPKTTPPPAGEPSCYR